MTLTLFVLVLAVVLLFLAAIKLVEPPHLSYGWMGLFLLAMLELFGRGHLPL